MGLKTPFEFFERDINKNTELIETVKGLKSVREIADNTHKILEKAGIKNDEGEYVDVDVSKLTDDDKFYLFNVTPTGLNAYQGYRLKYYESENGKEEYIQRYEIEKREKLFLLLKKTE